MAFADCTALKSISLPSSVEILSRECFSGCTSLDSLIFESGSELKRIEAKAFARCSSLQSICIPQSLNALCKSWALGSSLQTVVFESAASLAALIEGNDADLNGAFEIKILTYDCDLDLEGYSVDDRQTIDGFVHLVRKGSLP
jgi:hypothetical protein